MPDLAAIASEIDIRINERVFGAPSMYAVILRDVLMINLRSAVIAAAEVTPDADIRALVEKTLAERS